jgi:dipeptidyl aminopeptidase/acylaminoacyl peptidase
VITKELPGQVLKILPIAGGEPREVLRVKEPESILFSSVIDWTPDGRHLIFAKQRTKQSSAELWRVSVEGGEPQSLGITSEQVLGLQVHPDGRRIAYSGGRRGVEVWVMENFLQAAQNRKTPVAQR